MSGTSQNQIWSLPPQNQQSYPSFHPYGQHVLLTRPHHQYTYADVLSATQTNQYVNKIRTQPIRRKRASRPKVRTGCKTCKVRKVKCGEERPSCLRCTSTGRKCDGYELPAKEQVISKVKADDGPPSASPQDSVEVNGRCPQAHQVSVPSLAVQSINRAFEGTTQERRAFHRFQLRTVPVFAGGSETEFWTQFVLRAAASEEVIREALIALGNLHEEYEDCNGKYDQAAVASPAYNNAASLYGRAIGKLYRRLDTVSGETVNLAIIASILFACFEVLRRNNMAAVIHYQNGMRQLMKQIHERSQRQMEEPVSSKDKNALVRSAPQDDLDVMLRVFARYDIQACTFSKPKVEALSIELSAVPPNDIGLLEVRRYLDNLLMAVYQLLKSDLGMFRYWRSGQVSPTWIEKRDNALSTFQGWLDALELSIPSDAVTLQNHGIVASKSILGLVLQVRIAMIMLRTCIDCGPESTYDQFTPEFDEMVKRVENLTTILCFKEAAPLDQEFIPFSMELGVVHPLFFIAWKCREPSTRRRAISELKKCGKEGVWEGPIMAVMAERIAAIEEEGVEPGIIVPEGQRIHEIRKSVEYDKRIINAEMKLAQDSSWKNWTILREGIPF
ncbi:hypothetical protein LTR05_001695 [Lithohypha guttulata]|uniref:Zn(2)-C6 fungal-type domain-containing protein n=1 Tax=Lithohypha guttulata TaxID=1690604 RepID=A0AAN7TIT0_9EURO|nr:hypothetical protein LTR05_001695 [Lithohypha guttulata]